MEWMLHAKPEKVKSHN